MSFQDVVCPAEEDITPCVCYEVNPETLDIDCSAVLDEDELAAVFQANFPSTSFRRLVINSNPNLKLLRNGDLGEASFQEIWITQGVLEAIEEGALSGSSSTLLHLVFNYNNISTFPFADLESFTELISLDLRSNNIEGFPTLSSATLKTLYLSKNPLGILPDDAFFGTPALEDIHLSSTKISVVNSGTFAELEHLTVLGLGNNLITYLEEEAIQCSPSVGLIDLGYNALRSVQANAFPGLVNGWIYIHHNALRVLEENIWKPILLQGGYIDPYGNPLQCGCDIAWAVRNSSLINGFDIYSTCSDGRRLTELDPVDYENC